MRRNEEGFLVFDNRTEWRESTPYASTTVSAAKSEMDIKRLLLDEYKAEEVIISERQGGQAVIAFAFQEERFLIIVRRAKIRKETQEDMVRLRRQAYRVLHWYLKALLEMRFLMPEKELLMPFMMLNVGDKVVRVADAILGGLLMPALPPGSQGDVIEGETREVE